MSKKQTLHRALAMSLILASSLYCQVGWAATNGVDGVDKIETISNLTDADIASPITITGNSGGTAPSSQQGEVILGKGGKAGDVVFEAVSTTDLSNNIDLTLNSLEGGTGAYGYGANTRYSGDGGAGGDVRATIIVQGSSVSHQDITLDADAGGRSGGNAPFGNSSATQKITSAANNAAQGGQGGAASLSINVQSVNYSVQDITMTATGGRGGGASVIQLDSNESTDTYFASDVDLETFKFADAGNGGQATASGLLLDQNSALTSSISAADLNITAIGGAGGNGYTGKDYSCYMSGVLGGIGGAAEAYGIKAAALLKQQIQIQVNSIQVTAQGGDTGINETTDIKVNTKTAQNGGIGEAYGIYNQTAATNVTVTAAIESTALGGQGGKGIIGRYSDTNAIAGGQGGIGGISSAVGIYNTNGLLSTGQSIDVVATGGQGGQGGQGGLTDDVSLAFGTGGSGGLGGDTEAIGVQNTAGISNVTMSSIEATATGGQGGQGGLGGSDSLYNHNNYNDRGRGGDGGTGGQAYAVAVHASGGLIKISAEDVLSTANAGEGGTGGDGGIGYSYGSNYDKSNNDGALGGDGGNGGLAGNAYAYGLHAVGGNIDIQADKINAIAVGAQGGAGGAGGVGSMGSDGTSGHNTGYNGGTGGNGGNGSTAGAAGQGGQGGQGLSGGQNGQAGQTGQVGNVVTDLNSQETKAYGVYADNGSIVNLSAKTGDTITIGVKASGAKTNEAYAVYVDGATVLFHDNAMLNNDTTGVNNNVVTYLNNATLGFGGQTAGRTVTGGVLNLQGSNTFMVNTDLTNNAPTADKLTFASLAAGSSSATQYISIGYDPMITQDKIHIDLSGQPIEILEITNLNNQTLTNFKEKTNTFDGVLNKFEITPEININGNKIEITGATAEQLSTPSEGVATASDAMMSASNLWRIEGNNLMKRMGELRSDPEAAKGGVWARYYRGEMTADSSYGRSFDQDYTAFQGGIDRVQAYKGGRLFTGIAVNHIDANATYHQGRGEGSSTGMGLYASWLGDKGHYVDVIMRASRLNTNFKLADTSGNNINADYSTWAYGLSAEYGYRHKLQAGWFVEPQAELSLGHINSAEYTMSNGAKMENGSINSATGRLGFILGKEFKTAQRTGNAYFKASLYHEFGGKGSLVGRYGNDIINADGSPAMGTWYEVGVGTNLGIAKNSNLYIDALKTFGGKINTKWQINAGVRVGF